MSGFAGGWWCGVVVVMGGCRGLNGKESDRRRDRPSLSTSSPPTLPPPFPARYDWDKSGDLQVKEVFGILHELKFNDVTEDLVEALFRQYDVNGDGDLDREEYLEMIVDALVTLDGSEVTWVDSAFKLLTNSNPSLTLASERPTLRRAALYFDESDSAENFLPTLNLGPLGGVDVVNGFEVMCRADDFTVTKQERAE